MRRVALIGMNNPLSEDPRHALFPHPPGCTGWRIWQMLRARTGATKTDYLRAFHRYNLGNERHWHREKAEAYWKILEPTLTENFDTIVLLGAAVRQAADILVSNLYVTRALIALPHPSGLNRWYNDDRNRQIVEIILEELYVEATAPSGSRAILGDAHDLAPISEHETVGTRSQL